MFNDDGPAKVEPNAEMRTMAVTFRQMFVALTDEGFTTTQALQIIGMALAAGAQGGGHA